MTGSGEDALGSLNCGSLRLGPAQEIMDLNETLAAWRGLPRDALLRGSLEMLLSRGSWVYWDVTVDPVLAQQGHAWDLALKLGSEQGTPVEVLVNARRDDDGTRCILFPFSGRLLWERRLRAAQDQAREHRAQIERLQKIERFRRDFINIVAHELGTPMTPLRLQAHVLQYALGPHAKPELQRPMDEIRANLDRLSRMIASMIRSADVAAGRLDMDIRPIDVGQILPRIVDTWRRRHASSRSIGIEVQDAIVPADRDALTTCLENLLENAVKFSPAGTDIQVKVTAGPPVRIVVEDEGRGIEPDRLEGLGRPFAQAHDRNDVTTLGMGLGLHIVTGLMDAQGGRFDIESEGPGRGTRAILEFPRREVSGHVDETVSQVSGEARS